MKKNTIIKLGKRLFYIVLYFYLLWLTLSIFFWSVSITSPQETKISQTAITYKERTLHKDQVREVQENTVEVIEVVEEPVVEYQGVLIPSSLTAEELEKGLRYDLVDYANTFIQAEQETGINAVFLASVSALESGWGRSDVANEYNNLFGWSSNNGYKHFESKEECILFVAHKIKELYLT